MSIIILFICFVASLDADPQHVPMYQLGELTAAGHEHNPVRYSVTEFIGNITTLKCPSIIFIINFYYFCPFIICGIDSTLIFTFNIKAPND